MSLSPGVRLGPYEVTAALGAGGMGEVYRARDTRLRRDVAINRIYFLSPDGWIMESVVSRAAGRISPAPPVRVVPATGSDFIPASDGQRCLVMESAPRRPVAVANWSK